jgi:accessory gene regulator protein AgrB
MLLYTHRAAHIQHTVNCNSLMLTSQLCGAYLLSWSFCCVNVGFRNQILLIKQSCIYGTFTIFMFTPERHAQPAATAL